MSKLKKMIALATVTAFAVTSITCMPANATGADPSVSDGFKLLTNFNRYTSQYHFENGYNLIFDNIDKPGAWKIAIEPAGLGGSNALSIGLTDYAKSDEVLIKSILALGDEKDFTGATDFWAYIDIPADVELSGLFFSFKIDMYSNADYTMLDGSNPASYYIQLNGSWQEKQLNEKNCIPGEDIKGYKGFVRIPLTNFHQRDGKDIQLKNIINNINAVAVGVQPKEGSNNTGKKIIADQIGFSGTGLKGQGSVADVLAGKQLVDALPSNPDYTKQMKPVFDFEETIFLTGQPLSSPADKYIQLKKVNLETNAELTFASTDLGKSLVFKSIHELKGGDGIRFAPKDDLKGVDFLPDGTKIASNASDSGVIFYIDTTGYTGPNHCLFQFETYDFDKDGNYVMKDEEDDETGKTTKKKQTTRYGFSGGNLAYMQASNGNFDVPLEANTNDYLYLPLNYKGYIAIPFSSFNVIWETEDVNGLVDLQHVKEFQLFLSGGDNAGSVIFDNIGFFGPAYGKSVVNPGGDTNGQSGQAQGGGSTTNKGSGTTSNSSAQTGDTGVAGAVCLAGISLAAAIVIKKRFKNK